MSQHGQGGQNAAADRDLVPEQDDAHHVQWPRLCEAFRLIGNFVDSETVGAVPGLCDAWQPLKANLKELAELPHHPTHIGLLGSTGIGKSSLINALLGHRVLPARHVGGSTTSSVIELAWSDALDNGNGAAAGHKGAEARFEVKVHLLSEEAWVRFRVEKAREWADPNNGLPSTERQALMHLFRPLFRGQLRAKFALIAEPLRRALLDPDGRPEPDEFLKLLRTPGNTEVYRLNSAEEARRIVDSYQGDHPAALAATRIVIKGPFELLRGGMRFIDLPGLHDVNTFRGRIAERSIRNCSHIWMLGAAGGFASVADNAQILERLLRDGMFARCAVVATKADQLHDDNNTDAETLRQGCRDRIASLIEEQVELADADLPTPPIVLTSSRNALGMDELSALVAQYERQLFGHVGVLMHALVEALDTMAADLGNRAPASDDPNNDGGSQRAFRGTPEQRQALVENITALLDRVCAGFRNQLQGHSQVFLQQFAAVREGSVPHWATLVTRQFQRMGHPATMKAVLTRGGGPWRARNGNYFDLNESLGQELSNPLQARWRDLFVAMETAGQRLELDMHVAVNTALVAAKRHEYFQHARDDAALDAALGPVQDLRTEVPGQSLPFHDHFYPEDILAARRNFREDVIAAVRREAAARGLFSPTPAGDGYVDRTLWIMQDRVHAHGGHVGFAAQRAIEARLLAPRDGFLGRVLPNLNNYRNTMQALLLRRIALAEQHLEHVPGAVEGAAGPRQDAHDEDLAVVANLLAIVRQSVLGLIQGEDDDIDEGIAMAFGNITLDAGEANPYAETAEEAEQRRERIENATTAAMEQLQAQAAAEVRQAPQRICSACLELTPLDGGLLCPLADEDPEAAHFFCAECINDLIRARCGDMQNITGLDTSGGLLCGDATCECKQPYADVKLTPLLQPEILVLYITAKAQKVAQVIAEQMREAERELEEARGARGVVEGLAHELFEQLNSKCPRCGTAFHSFDGCFALECSTCPTYFCAYCLEGYDNDHDAHAHVCACADNLAGGNLFADEIVYRLAEHNRKQRTFDEFWAREDVVPHRAALRERVLPNIGELIVPE